MSNAEKLINTQTTPITSQKRYGNCTLTALRFCARATCQPISFVNQHLTCQKKSHLPNRCRGAEAGPPRGRNWQVRIGNWDVATAHLPWCSFLYVIWIAILWALNANKTIMCPHWRQLDVDGWCKPPTIATPNFYRTGNAPGYDH